MDHGREAVLVPKNRAELWALAASELLEDRPRLTAQLDDPTDSAHRASTVHPWIGRRDGGSAGPAAATLARRLALRDRRSERAHERAHVPGTKVAAAARDGDVRQRAERDPEPLEGRRKW